MTCQARQASVSRGSVSFLGQKQRSRVPKTESHTIRSAATFSCCAVEITQKPRGIVEYALFTNTVHTFSTPLLRENRHRAANRYATESSSDLERSAKEFYGRIRQNRRTCLRPQEKRNRTCKQDRQTKGAPGAMQLRFRDIRRDLTPPPNYVRQKRRRVLVCTESIL